jgi:short-subunit dehydrogenase
VGQQTAVIVGASGAFGSVIAAKLIEHGLSVVGVGRDRAALDRLARQLRDRIVTFYAPQLLTIQLGARQIVYSPRRRNERTVGTEQNVSDNDHHRRS